MRRRRHSRARDVSGILLLDKPKGLTSNAVLQTVKRQFRARKAGHTGSLDPLATGLLPICLGQATKLSSFLLEADKHYHTTLRLGVRTTTGDAEGETIAERSTAGIDRDRVAGVLAEFRGEIEQVPPMHSAVKQNGVPLYKLAHRGIEVQRAARSVAVHSLELLGFDGDDVELQVHCSKGTYVRVLADEIGESLGCGAHVSALRRTGVASFEADAMVTLERVQELAEQGVSRLDQLLVSMEDALGQWPGVHLSQEVAYFLRQGQPVFVPHAPTDGLVKIYTREDRFLGVGHILEDGRVAPKRLISS